MTTITPFLWFDDQLEEAVELYTSVFPDAKVHSIDRGPDGKAFTAEFEIAGQRVMGLNGGPADFGFTDALSLFVRCDGQDEVDRYWDALTADGGEAGRCGWLKDRYGVSWQIIPREFLEMMSDSDPGRRDRVMSAMLTMSKFDVDALREAYASP